MSYSYPNRPPKPVVERVPVKPCCAKCRRGIKGFGELPCGYPESCPNETCAHSELGAHTKAVAFLAKDTPMDGSAAMSHHSHITSHSSPAKQLSPTSDTTARNEQTKPAGGHTRGEA